MLLYWIWFAQLKNLSCAQKQMLLQYFRDPEEIYHSSGDAFSAVEGITEAMLQALEDKSLEEAQKILEDCTDKGIRVLTFADRAYPVKLKNTYDPPMVLYFKGTLPSWEEIPAIGVVGTRKATPYGMRAAYRYAGQISACGGIVVSGGADGIDTKAMEGALAAGGTVVGVLGCGVDVVYPAKNKHLFADIAQRGCLLSEYPPREKALGWHFPRRNRIISGISNGLLVVEAPQKSGALITARLAYEQGREVFVVPGNVDEPACAGSNALMQEQAIAALSGWDVIKEYQALYPGKIAKRELPAAFEGHRQGTARQTVVAQERLPKMEGIDKKSIDKEAKSTYSVVNNPVASLNDQEKTVLEQISWEPVTIDSVIERTGMSVAAVKVILTKLTIQGVVANHPGGRIARK